MSSIRTCPRPLLVVAVIGAVSADWSVFIRCKCYTLVKLLGFCKFAVAFGRASASLGLRLKGTLGTGKQLGMEQEWRWAPRGELPGELAAGKEMSWKSPSVQVFQYQIISQGERKKNIWSFKEFKNIKQKRRTAHSKLVCSTGFI